jgi:hypothetical protein
VKDLASSIGPDLEQDRVVLLRQRCEATTLLHQDTEALLAVRDNAHRVGFQMYSPRRSMYPSLLPTATFAAPSVNAPAKSNCGGITH